MKLDEASLTMMTEEVSVNLIYKFSKVLLQEDNNPHCEVLLKT